MTKPKFIILDNSFPVKFHQEMVAYATNPNDFEVIADGDPARFGTIEALNAWLLKGRTCFTLTDAGQSRLLGLYWFGKLEMPGVNEMQYDAPLNPAKYQHTYSLRLYAPLRGTGQGREIFAEILRRYMNGSHYDNTGLWGSTQHAGTIKVSENVGMHQMTTPKIDARFRSNPMDNPRVVIGGTDGEVRAALKKYLGR
ncbi:MAG: hypothetical protein FWF97_03820 [Alphaproteobacteria bacterium]|nr:hypothetical protein [Alphaproteobacteria bacterium]